MTSPPAYFVSGNMLLIVITKIPPTQMPHFSNEKLVYPNNMWLIYNDKQFICNDKQFICNDKYPVRETCHTPMWQLSNV